MKNELISVIVPIYNVEDYLKKCVDSIINQTYKNLEIILVDDGSTDNCRIICDNYKKKDKRIVVIHKDNGGLSSAKNSGLDVACGNLVSFVDGDDFIELTMFEELKNNMNKYDSDIAICDYDIIGTKRKKRENKISNIEYYSINKEKYDNVYNNNSVKTIVSWGKIYKIELFNNIRFPDKKIYEDAYILFDLIDKAKKISYLSRPLYNYVYRKNSLANSFSINHFNSIIESHNKNIICLNKKKYYDLELIEKKRKMDSLIICLSRMKQKKIKNKKIYNMYYKELININKDIKWKNANKKIKLFKLIKKPTIYILSIKYKIKIFKVNV